MKKDPPPPPCRSSKKAGHVPGKPSSGGYGNPPKEFQWKKGQSGNPSGLRKNGLSKAMIRSMLEDVLFGDSVTLKDRHGEPKGRVPKLHGLLLETSNRAMKGSARDTKIILDLVDRYLVDEEPQSIQESATEDEAILRRHGLYAAGHAGRGSSEEPAAGEDETGDNEEGGEP